MKLGKKIPNKKCKWCGTWNVYECGNAHTDFGLKLTCRDCNGYGQPGLICNDPKHPSHKPRWDV